MYPRESSSSVSEEFIKKNHWSRNPETFDRIAELTAFSFEAALAAVFVRDRSGFHLVGCSEKRRLSSRELFHYVGELAGLNDQHIDQHYGPSTGVLHLSRGPLAPGSLAYAVVASEECNCSVIVCAYTAGSNQPWSLSELPHLEDFAQLVVNEVEIVEMARQAARASREFTSLVSHELRTPLTSIIASLEMLNEEMDGSIPADSLDLVDMALRNSHRLSNLVDDILDVSKMEMGKMDLDVITINPGAVVDNVVELHQSFAASRQVTLLSSYQADHAHVFADPARLEQVLTNLISNAIKVSPSGKDVEVNVDILDERWVRICVIDQGPGIPEDFQEQLFEKFTQARTPRTSQQTGTGLGLTIVKGLTERMGGRVSYETAPGQGTIMSVDLLRA